jgi:SAM-dependent methyltransferase
MKLNIGCGTDYREGFINIDGSKTLPRIDRVIDIANESLLQHFQPASVDYILANDIVEHHFHWEAVRILREFHALLKPGGCAEIRVPDAAHIIKSWRYSMEMKLTLLFGGQDVPQGDNAAMNASRKESPQFFCHKYGWTKERLMRDLKASGFSEVRCKRSGSNFIATARK